MSRVCDDCGGQFVEVKRIQTALGPMWEIKCTECDHFVWQVA